MKRDMGHVRVITTRVRLLFDLPLVGVVVTRLHVVEAKGWPVAFQICGRDACYDPEKFEALTEGGRFNIVAMEGLNEIYEAIGPKFPASPNPHYPAVEQRPEIHDETRRVIASVAAMN